MKKFKMGFGEGGFQGFMARHVEKCVLAVVTAVMAWFIYSGTGAKALESSITKEALQTKASQADTQITNSKWETVAKDRDPKQDVFDIIKKQTAKVDSRPYAYRAWDLPLVPRLTPRLDPKIFPPEKLVVTAFAGPLVLVPPDTEEELKDPLDDYEITIGGSTGYGGTGMPSNETKDDAKGKDKEKKPGREPKTKGYSSYAQQPPMGPMGKGKSKKGEEPYEMSYPASGSMGAGVKQARTIPPEATLGVKATQGSILQPRTAMVINAVVPYNKQWDAYREAFKDAPGGQDPERDVPNYIAVWVEVLDVTDDPSVDPATAKGWRRISRAELTELAKLESGEAEGYGAEVLEIADPEAVDPVLTHKIPPFLLTNLQPALLHPDVPKAAEVVEEEEMEEDLEFIETEGGTILKDSDAGGTGRGPGGGRYPAAGGGRYPGAGGGRSPSMGYGRGTKAPPGIGARGATRGSYSTSGMGSGSDLETYRPIAKKLVRFVDYNVQPGHKYRYRMQVVLNDPNRPEDPEVAPDITTLDEKARERVKALEAAEKAAEKAGKRVTRRYWITSPWSEASDIVSVPTSEWFYAGATIPAATINIAGATIATNEPSSTVLTVKWDPKLGVFAPAEQTTHRGSVLDFKGDVEVLHPVLGDLRKVPGYELRTEGIVLDIMGGDKLPGTADSKEQERAPGETLVMDASGNLIVTNEAQDVESYRRYIFPEPKEPTTSKESSSGSMEMEPPGYPMGKGGKASKGGPSPQPPGMKGYPGYPGASKPGRAGRPMP